VGGLKAPRNPKRQTFTKGTTALGKPSQTTGGTKVPQSGVADVVKIIGIIF
jgi:hypothetical protein